MIVKLMNHSSGLFEVLGDERKKLLEDITKDGSIADPIEVFKTHKMIIEKDEEGSEDVVSVPFIFSTGTVDRDRERVNPKGWVLDNYNNNPVVLWMHERSRPAIAFGSEVKVKKNQLTGIITFAPKKIDHFAWSIGQKLLGGFLSAGSVGFRPIEWKWLDDSDDEADLEFMKQELFEFSVVNLPANPDAVNTMPKKDDELAKRIDKIEEFLSSGKVKKEITLDEFLTGTKV